MVMKYPILFTYHFLNVIILHILLNYQPMTNKYIYIFVGNIPFWEVSEIPKCHEFYLILIISFLGP
jgi:hypothetical protein